MTREELVKFLEKRRIPSDWYSLYGELLPDRIIMYENYKKWEVFYLDERGGRKMLRTCRSEEDACVFVYQQLMHDMLTSESIFFSRLPLILPQEKDLIMEIGFIEIGIRFWLDSIINEERNWSEVELFVFELERDSRCYQKYIIHLYGSDIYSCYNKNICFSVDAIPYHDWVSIKSERNEDDFEKEISDTICKCIYDSKKPEYGRFFSGKRLCIGFKNRMHLKKINVN